MKRKYNFISLDYRFFTAISNHNNHDTTLGRRTYKHLVSMCIHHVTMCLFDKLYKPYPTTNHTFNNQHRNASVVFRIVLCVSSLFIYLTQTVLITSKLREDITSLLSCSLTQSLFSTISFFLMHIRLKILLSHSMHLERWQTKSRGDSIS